MEKQHQSPEFLVVRQEQENSKFFVASGFSSSFSSSSPGQSDGDDGSVTSFSGEEGLDL